MRILVVGGGSGGHVTPILPVADQLKAAQPQSHIDFIGQRNDHASLSIKNYKNIDAHHYIFAGKWRRYSNQSFLQKMLDIPTLALNARDVLYLFLGCIQSFFMLLRLKPAVIFIKGGYVGVPVGLAATILRIPFITHDSDTLPGFANRIISRWARKNAVGAPPENYNYAPGKIAYTGIPIRPIAAIDLEAKLLLKEQLGLEKNVPVVMVTGGGNGAESINSAAVAIAEEITRLASVVHVAGADKEAVVSAAVAAKSITSNRYKVLGYTDAFIAYIQVADIVVTRAGATTIAELATAQKAAIVVPAPQLADQAKNAASLARHGLLLLDDAALLSDPGLLLQEVKSILNEPRKKTGLEASIAALSLPDAAQTLAALLIATAEETNAQ